MIGFTLFKIGSVTIYTYGLFLVVGIILACVLMYYLARASEKKTEYILDYIVYTALFGIVGARLAFYILYHSQFTSFVDIFKIWQGGLVSYGGFIFGITAFILAVRSTKEKILPWLDILLISALLGLAIGRLGSFLSGEIAGISHTGFLSANGMYPITLFEAIWNFLIFIFLSVFYFRGHSSMKSGIIALESLMLYSLGRFFIEFFRAEDKVLIGLSLSQIILVFIFIISGILFASQVIGRKGERNAG